MRKFSNPLVWIRAHSILIPSVYSSPNYHESSNVIFPPSSLRPLYVSHVRTIVPPSKKSTTPNSVKGVVFHRERYICQVNYKKQFVFKNNKQYIKVLT